MPSTPPPSEQITQIFRIISEALSIPSSSSSSEEENFLPHETWKYHGLTGLLASATAADISRYLTETETTGGGGGGSSKREVPQNVFEKYPTVGEFRRWIFGVLGEDKDEDGEGEGEEDGEGEDVKKEQEPENPWEGIPKPKVPLSVVLQGKVSTASKIVFLFPDGSGAGTAYGSLPDLGEEDEGKDDGKGGICIIGLNSPFLRQAHKFTCSIERMTRLWYDEVRKLQAQAQTPTKEKQKQKQTIPYILGGWSAGGYYSYEMAKLLTGAGEIVSTLILIDSPCRLLYEALPVQVVEELTKKGLMGASSSSSSSSLQQKKAAPEWLVQHFTSTVLSVQRYQPVAMREARVPGNVYCIWVEEGLVETSVEESGLDVDVNVRVTRFLLEGRRGKKKLESEGWEKLLPGAEFGFEYMTGNHFQITQVPHVRFFFPFFFLFFSLVTSLPPGAQFSLHLKYVRSFIRFGLNTFSSPSSSSSSVLQSTLDSRHHHFIRNR